ncbi:MAG: hypothetical protein P8X57_01895 [Cyclobacteriaceae bacterium]
MIRSIIIFLILSFLSVSGLSAQDSYIWVFLNTNPERENLGEEEVNDIQRRHLENIGKLAREGKLLVAGPFNSGGGIFIMNTADMQLARQWILSDPAIRANRFRIEMFEWTPRIGNACLAGEEAAMKEHTFVRYVPHITKFNVQQSPRLFLEHDRYLDKNLDKSNVLAEGIFGNNDGGIIVFDEKPDKEMILADPTVIEGIFLPEFKTIWIANGSFCENKGQ